MSRRLIGMCSLWYAMASSALRCHFRSGGFAQYENSGRYTRASYSWSVCVVTHFVVRHWANRLWVCRWVLLSKTPALDHTLFVEAPERRVRRLPHVETFLLLVSLEPTEHDGLLFLISNFAEIGDPHAHLRDGGGALPIGLALNRTQPLDSTQ